MRLKKKFIWFKHYFQKLNRIYLIKNNISSQKNISLNRRNLFSGCTIIISYDVRSKKIHNKNSYKNILIDENMIQ